MVKTPKKQSQPNKNVRHTKVKRMIGSAIVKSGERKWNQSYKNKKLKERCENYFPSRKFVPPADKRLSCVPVTTNSVKSALENSKNFQEKNEPCSDPYYEALSYASGDETLKPSKQVQSPVHNVGNAKVNIIDLTDSPDIRSVIKFKERHISTSTPLMGASVTPEKQASFCHLDISPVAGCVHQTPKKSVTRQVDKELTVTKANSNFRITKTFKQKIIYSLITSDESTLLANSFAEGEIRSVSETVVSFTSKRTIDPVRLGRDILKLSTPQKSDLLNVIARNLLGACYKPVKLSSGRAITNNLNIKEAPNKDDIYIKEVILNKSHNRFNRYGSNIYSPYEDVRKSGLRMIVIDGSNVAISHGNGQFSVGGLKICIDYFLRRGHVVKAFVPHFRCKRGKSSNPKMLSDLEQMGHVVFTPSREIQGRNVVPYDDRYIIQCAAAFEGVIVSGDNYRDLMDENPNWRSTIENRLLQFTWVGDLIMFPADPLGRNGPSLKEFLAHGR